MSQRPGTSGLSWGVLGRFTDYVRGSGGTITASGGALVDETGMPSWPLTDATGFGGGTGVLRFAGTVRFAAHFGALDLPLADPVLAVTGARGDLRLTTHGDSLVLAEFAWAEVPGRDGVRLWVGSEVTLAAAAVPLFGGSYPAAMPLDPLIVALSAGAD